VLTYLSVAGLCVGTVILFGLSVPVVSSVEQVRVLQPGAITASPATAADCVQTAQEMSVTHTERTWWLLAASPYVVVADAAPAPDLPAGGSAFDPLSAIRDGVRSAKAGPPEVYDWCTPSGTAGPDGDRLADVGAAWPWGLGLNLLLGAAGALVSVRRLRTPMRSLPRGTRVA
jgi:hypothetical protein